MNCHLAQVVGLSLVSSFQSYAQPSHRGLSLKTRVNRECTRFLTRSLSDKGKAWVSLMPFRWDCCTSVSAVSATLWSFLALPCARLTDITWFTQVQAPPVISTRTCVAGSSFSPPCCLAGHWSQGVHPLSTPAPRGTTRAQVLVTNSGWFYPESSRPRIHFNVIQIALSVLMLCTPVFIFTSGSSALLGRIDIVITVKIRISALYPISAQSPISAPGSTCFFQ